LGNWFFLHGLYFIESSDTDLAVTMLPWEYLESHGIRNIYVPQLESLPPIYERTGAYHLMGYPASKNKFDLRYDNMASKIMVIEAKLDTRNLNLSEVSTAINIYYDHKAYGSTLPALQGMSGGPLYEVLSRKIGDKNGLSLFPRGVLCEWRRVHRIVVAINIDSVVKLIEEKSIIWDLAGKTHACSVPSIWAPVQPLENYLPIDISSPKPAGDVK